MRRPGSLPSRAFVRCPPASVRADGEELVQYVDLGRPPSPDGRDELVPGLVLPAEVRLVVPRQNRLAPIGPADAVAAEGGLPPPRHPGPGTEQPEPALVGPDRRRVHPVALQCRRARDAPRSTPPDGGTGVLFGWGAAREASGARERMTDRPEG